MKKLFFSLFPALLILLFFEGQGQSVLPRMNSGSNTAEDRRVIVRDNFIMPRYADTATANLNKGIDSCGAKILTYEGGNNKEWTRFCSPKRWVAVNFSSATGGGGGIDTAYLNIRTVLSGTDTCLGFRLNENPEDTICILGNGDSFVDSLYFHSGENTDSLFYSKGGIQYLHYVIDIKSYGVLSGGEITNTLNPYCKDVAAVNFRIDRVRYSAEGVDSLCLEPCDSLPRIDVIYADTLGNIAVLTGVPDSVPTKPQVDQSWQVELSFATIQCDTTDTILFPNYVIFGINNKLNGHSRFIYDSVNSRLEVNANNFVGKPLTTKLSIRGDVNFDGDQYFMASNSNNRSIKFGSQFNASQNSIMKIEGDVNSKRITFRGDGALLNTVSILDSGQTHPSYFGTEQAYEFAVFSTRKGILFPRLNTAQMVSSTSRFANAFAGIVVYNTDSATLCCWDGAVWKICGGGTGGAGSTPNLQQVTDVGNTSTNNIELNGGASYIANDGSFASYFASGNTAILGDGHLTLKGVGTLADIRVDNLTTFDREYQLPAYTTGISQTLVTSVKVNGTEYFADATGKVDIGTIGGGGTYTVDNGLYENTAGNFRWGGPLVENTTVTMSGFNMDFTGNGFVSALLYDGSGTTGQLSIGKNGQGVLGGSDGVGNEYLLRVLNNAAQVRYEQSGNGQATVEVVADAGPNPYVHIYTENSTFSDTHEVNVRREGVTITGTVASSSQTNLYAPSLPVTTTANILYYDNVTGQVTYDAAPAGSTSVLFETNSVTNSSQVLLNLIQGTNVTLSESAGGVTINSTNDWHLAGNGSTSPGTHFLGTTDAQDVVFKTNSTEYMRLKNSNGSLGINTSLPVAPLHVLGTYNVQYGSEFLSGIGWTSTNWTGSWATGWTHTTGFTTTLTRSSPTATIGVTYRIQYTITGRTAGSLTSMSFGGGQVFSISATGQHSVIATSANGLSLSPTSDFDGTIIISIKAVSGASTIPVQRWASSGATFNSTTFNTGNADLRIDSFSIGLGVESISRNVTGMYNTSVGYMSLANNSTASSNTAMGYQAAKTNTSGGDNVAMGSNALSLGTTASLNVAIGSQAMLNGTTGTQNVAAGYQALLQGLGTGNVAVGNQAMLSTNASATVNTAVGYQSMQSLTSGTNNVAMGYRSMWQISSGTFNVGLGSEALNGVATGIGSVAIGYRALQVFSGNYNIGVGYQSGAFSTGIGGVYMGYQAGMLQESGTYNTSLGYHAGYGNRGYNNVSVGANAHHYGDYHSGNVSVGNNAAYYSENYFSTIIGDSAGFTFKDNASAAKTFDKANISGTSITITAHGFGTTGISRLVRFTQGSGSFTNLTNNALYHCVIVDANTVRLVALDLASFYTTAITIAGGVGTTGHTLTPAYEYSNATAIGHRAEPSASNQIVLGDTYVTQLLTAAKPKLTAYGAGTVTGTATYGAAFDASGNVIEVVLGGGSSATFVYNEIPSGSVNSSNMVFTLAHTPIANMYSVYINGVKRKKTTDYGISGTTLTFTFAPTTGDDIDIDYNY